MNKPELCRWLRASVVDPARLADYVHRVNTRRESDRHCSLPQLDLPTFALLRLLHSRPQLSQRGVAASLGMSLGKANNCIRSLIHLGLVRAQDVRDVRNKLSFLYTLTPSGLVAKTELTRDLLAKKVLEFQELSSEIEQLRRESDAEGRHAEASIAAT